MESSSRHLAVLPLAVIAVSFGAILIRLSSDATPLAIAAWRLTIAALVFAPFAARDPSLRTLSRRTFSLCALSGAFLALHFILWITSLRSTSVASSVVLVSMSPVFVAVGSSLFLKERPPRRVVGAVLLSVAGVAVISIEGLRQSSTSWGGDLMALGGAIMAAGYFVAGRRVRQTVPLRVYAFLTYACAALILLMACAVTGQTLVGFSGRTTLFLVLLALGPQVIGHSTFNWALRYLPASTIALITLAEPIGSALLAFLILGEGISLLKGAGGLLILIGIYLGIERGKR
jgi:drug/metabolite transporter (DMT)-like permease